MYVFNFGLLCFSNKTKKECSNYAYMYVEANLPELMAGIAIDSQCLAFAKFKQLKNVF